MRLSDKSTLMNDRADFSVDEYGIRKGKNIAYRNLR